MLFFILLTNASLQTKAEILFTNLNNITSTLKLDQKTGKLYLQEKDLTYQPNFIIRKTEQKNGVVDIMSLNQPNAKIIPSSGMNDFSAFLDDVDTGKWKIKKLNDERYVIMFGGLCLTVENKLVNLRECIDDESQVFYITTDMSANNNESEEYVDLDEKGIDDEKNNRKKVRIIEEYDDGNSDADIDDSIYSDNEVKPYTKERKKNRKKNKFKKPELEDEMDSKEKEDFKNILEDKKIVNDPEKKELIGTSGDTNSQNKDLIAVKNNEINLKPLNEAPEVKKEINNLKDDEEENKNKRIQELKNIKKSIEEYCNEIKKNIKVTDTPKTKDSDSDKNSEKNKLGKKNKELESPYKYITQEEKPVAKVLTKTVTVTKYAKPRNKKENIKLKCDIKNYGRSKIRPRVKLPKRENYKRENENLVKKEPSTIEKIENLFKELGDDHKLIDEFKNQVSVEEKNVYKPPLMQPYFPPKNNPPCPAKINPNPIQNRRRFVNNASPIVYF